MRSIFVCREDITVHQTASFACEAVFPGNKQTWNACFSSLIREGDVYMYVYEVNFIDIED